MKKLLTIGITVLALAFGIQTAQADSTILITPQNISARAGQTVTATVIVNPNGERVYTAKVDLRYPANLLEVQGWTFGANIVPLTQSGYDAVDNTQGVLVKTAGFAGGINTPTVIGTITFRVKTAGTGSISVGPNTMVLDSANSNDLMAGATGVRANVFISSATTATVNPAPRAAAGGATVAEANTIATTTATTTINDISGTTTVGLPDAGANTAQAAGAFGNVSRGLLVGILVLLALIAIVYFAARRAY